jgi:nucleoside phosphorylase
VTIGVIAALPVEGAAMGALISDPQPVRIDGDPNDYRVGYLDSVEPGRPHRVVLTTMTEDNTRNAAMVCTDMLRTFPRIRCVILTGVAGGVPSPTRPEHHVRLGDVVVAVDGIVDYGHVRQGEGLPKPRRPVSGISMDMIRAVRRLQQRSYLEDLPAWARLLMPAQDQPMAVFARPPASADQLYVGDTLVEHPPLNESGHAEGCPKIHYGKIGCADVLIVNEEVRDELATRHGVLAFEMEAAGIAVGVAGRGVSWFMVRGIVDYCNGHKNDRWHPYASLSAAGCVRALLAECRPFPVWRMAAGSGVIALLPDHQLDRLMSLLAQARGLDAQEIWRAAMGRLTPLPETPGTLPQLAAYLAGINAGTDRVPPALAFADEVAARVEHRLGAQLRAWIDQMADRLGIVDVMRQQRLLADERRQRHLAAGQHAAPIRPCLLIQVERDGIDRDRCEVRYWIQRRSESWHPEPADPRDTTFRQVERVMQSAIRHAETVWRDNNGPVELELLLPTELLHKAVEWWNIELEAPAPTPLCLDYPVVVRSLDRMRAAYRHRVWANRWRSMWRHPPGHRLYWGRVGPGDSDLDQWNARLRDDRDLTTVVLSASPEHDAGHDELQSALNAGIPVILWDRRTPLAPDAARLLATIVDGAPDKLAHHIRALRSEAARLPPGERHGHPGRHLALLWDDPERNVYDGGPQR